MHKPIFCLTRKILQTAWSVLNLFQWFWQNGDAKFLFPKITKITAQGSTNVREFRPWFRLLCIYQYILFSLCPLPDKWAAFVWQPCANSRHRTGDGAGVPHHEPDPGIRALQDSQPAEPLDPVHPVMCFNNTNPPVIHTHQVQKSRRTTFVRLCWGLLSVAQTKTHDMTFRRCWKQYWRCFLQNIDI